MKIHTFTPEQINQMVELCMEELETHREYETESIYLKESDTDYLASELNFIGEGTPISPNRARIFLTQAIENRLRIGNFAILYTCRDNSLISVHGPEKDCLDKWIKHRDSISEEQMDGLYFDFD